MSKIPSPCIDVCKYRHRDHCIGCGMTKKQKKEWKSLEKGKQKRAFLAMLVAQQAELGKMKGWIVAYRKKCAKKGVDCPVDEPVGG